MIKVFTARAQGKFHACLTVISVTGEECGSLERLNDSASQTLHSGGPN